MSQRGAMNDLDHALRALADELLFKTPDRELIDVQRLEAKLTEDAKKAFAKQRHAALESYKRRYCISVTARRSAA